MLSKKVAILLPCLLTGGTEVASYEAARAFSNLGFTVTVIVYFDEVDLVMLEKFQAADINVQLLHQVRQNNLLALAKLAQILIKALWTRYDLVWVQYMTPTVLPLLIGKIFSKKMVACIHFSANHFSSSGISRVRWLSRYWCANIICVSKTTALGFFGDHTKQGTITGRVSVIPNAFNMTKTLDVLPRNWRQEQGWESTALIIGYVGRLAHVKGVDILLQAMAKLNKDIDCKLIIVGDGSEKEELISLAKNLDIYHLVYFAGRISHDQVLQAIKGFDIAIVPSRDEGFGLSALEAMSVGIPVIASRVGALSEVVIDTVTGLLYKSENPIDLTNKITSLLNDSEQRKKLGGSGMVHAKNCYSRSNFQDNIAKLLSRIEISNTKGGRA